MIPVSVIIYGHTRNENNMLNWINTQPSINTLLARLEDVEEALRLAQETIAQHEWALSELSAVEDQPGRDVALAEYNQQFRRYTPNQELLLQEVIGDRLITHMSGDKEELQQYMKSAWIAAKPPQFYVTRM